MTRLQFPASRVTKLVANVDLPALPQAALRVLQLSQDPKNGPVEYAVCIEADVGLTAQLLRLVNSAYFGLGHKVASVKHAVALAGTSAVRNFVLWRAVFSMMPDPKHGALHVNRLWQDSLRRALFARSLAKSWAIEASEEVFAGALLQDMGLPLLVGALPDLYGKLLDLRQPKAARLSQMEEQVFGWTHASVAGAVVRHWRLPEPFALLIENHTALDRLASERNVDRAALSVALSAMLPPAGLAWSEFDQFETHFRTFHPGSGPALVDLLRNTDSQFEKLAPLLKIPIPDDSLADAYHNTAPSAV